VNQYYFKITVSSVMTQGSLVKKIATFRLNLLYAFSVCPKVIITVWAKNVRKFMIF